MNKRRLVINILTSNRISELCICLTSLINQSFQEWDLVIIDDCSNQKCTDYKFFNDLIGRLKQNHGIKILRHEFPHKNIGKSRNECVEISKTFPHNTCEFILRIDDDSLCSTDYVQQLFDVITTCNDNVCAVGGVVPLLSGPDYHRRVPEIFNEVVFDKEGNITKLEDDGGVDYHLKGKVGEVDINRIGKLIISHHLRSSFMFKTKVHNEEPHPIEYGPTGFREETDLCLRWTFKGYKLLTNVNAVCYHQQARSGGARMDDNAYRNEVMNNEMLFKEKMKYLYKKVKKK